MYEDSTSIEAKEFVSEVETFPTLLLLLETDCVQCCRSKQRHR